MERVIKSRCVFAFCCYVPIGGGLKLLDLFQNILLV
jgi:hypothetical protein